MATTDLSPKGIRTVADAATTAAATAQATADAAGAPFFVYKSAVRVGDPATFIGGNPNQDLELAYNGETAVVSLTSGGGAAPSKSGAFAVDLELGMGIYPNTAAVAKAIEDAFALMEDDWTSAPTVVAQQHSSYIPADAFDTGVPIAAMVVETISVVAGDPNDGGLTPAWTIGSDLSGLIESGDV